MPVEDVDASDLPSPEERNDAISALERRALDRSRELDEMAKRLADTEANFKRFVVHMSDAGVPNAKDKVRRHRDEAVKDLLVELDKLERVKLGSIGRVEAAVESKCADLVSSGAARVARLQELAARVEADALQRSRKENFADVTDKLEAMAESLGINEPEHVDVLRSLLRFLALGFRRFVLGLLGVSATVLFAVVAWRVEMLE